MGFKKIYSKTKKGLTSPKAKKFYSNLGSAATKTGRYFEQVDRNLDNTFSISKKYPDKTLSNYNKNISEIKIRSIVSNALYKKPYSQLNRKQKANVLSRIY